MLGKCRVYGERILVFFILCFPISYGGCVRSLSLLFIFGRRAIRPVCAEVEYARWYRDNMDETQLAGHCVKRM